MLASSRYAGMPTALPVELCAMDLFLPPLHAIEQMPSSALQPVLERALPVSYVM